MTESSLNRPRVRRGRLPVPLALFVVSTATMLGAAAEPLGVRVPDGFEVSLFADDNLAHDIFSMTVDALGRIVVSGQGYVHILIDSDGDGRADGFKRFADGPASGAQGMFFLGRDLLCIGDGGLLRYRDQNGDDAADGPPDVFIKFATGGEHNMHAIRKGPDGWWYVLAGNMAGIDRSYANLPTSPVKEPQAGALLRLKPDLSGGEVVAHGFRNAYDFDFNRQGDLFTFDSDGERDVSLPWYRPTRVFHVLPGSHAGWVSESWKRPDYFSDMPPVVGSFGRGSPTGVTSYQHRQFPAEYHDALFICDWTYGRVFALPLKRNGETWSSESKLFMQAVGEFGFAPTDIEVGPDGSLYVSVGGRGTRGSVFRVAYSGRNTETQDGTPASNVDKLRVCLSAPQPLSSWSRSRWVPLAKELGREPFVRAALDARTDVPARMRAIEIVTEMFGGLGPYELSLLSTAGPAAVRARAVWSLGRIHSEAPEAELLAPYLNDRDPLVGRFALQALLGAGSAVNWEPLISGLVVHMETGNRFNRAATARLVPKLPEEPYRKLAVAASRSGWQAGMTSAFGFLGRSPGLNTYAITVGQGILDYKPHTPALKLDATRLLQLGVGDMGPTDQLDPVFHGYASQLDMSNHERDLDPLRIRISEMFPTGEQELDFELARLLAMLGSFNEKLLDRVLAKITDDSDPINDIHYLIVAARIQSARTQQQRDAMAKALVDLEPKSESRNYIRDSNWNDRVGEMYSALVKIDGELPAAIVRRPNFGRPAHVVLLSEATSDLLQPAIDVFVKQIESDDDYPWNNDVVFVLAESKNPAHRALIRKQFERFGVRNAVLAVLAKSPDPVDRQKFIDGLDSSILDIVSACVDALSTLKVDPDAGETLALVRALRRLGADKHEVPVRDRVAKLLGSRAGRDFGYEFGRQAPQTSAVERWTAWAREQFPQHAAALMGGSHEDVADLYKLLTEVKWDAADAARGRKLFADRSCVQCHGGGRALGPDLSGVAGRFSREDLFTAIALPNRDVSPRYQTTLIQTSSGKVYTGLIVYESVDGLLLRNATNQTFRIETGDIEVRRQLPQSLMPSGLLKGLQPQDLADLYAYIRSLDDLRTAKNVGTGE